MILKCSQGFELWSLWARDSQNGVSETHLASWLNADSWAHPPSWDANLISLRGEASAEKRWPSLSSHLISQSTWCGLKYGLKWRIEQLVQIASETRRKKNCSRNLREEWSIIITKHKIWLGFSCNRDLCPCYAWDINLTLKLGQPQVSLPVQWGWYYIIHRSGFLLSPPNGIPGKGQGAWTFQKEPRVSIGDLSSLVSCHRPTQAITPAKPRATFLVETSKLLLANAWQPILYGRLKNTSVSSRPRMGLGNVCWYHWVSRETAGAAGATSDALVPPPASPASLAAHSPVAGWIFMWCCVFTRRDPIKVAAIFHQLLCLSALPQSASITGAVFYELIKMITGSPGGPGKKRAQ